MTGSDTIDRAVSVAAAGAALEGTLLLPETAAGIVAFAHGSGSSRFSPRNRFVAEQLQCAGLGVLLFDLLTAEEDEVDRVTREHRFDIDLLARRLVGAVDWLGAWPQTAGLAIGCFGSSTGSAAALIAAAQRPDAVRAVVSRGGRSDLAQESLPRVRAPTLLVVGSKDDLVLRLNRESLAALRCEKRLEIIPGATHLFEAPGTLEQVAQLAAHWFVRHLTGRGLVA